VADAVDVRLVRVVHPPVHGADRVHLAPEMEIALRGALGAGRVDLGREARIGRRVGDPAEMAADEARVLRRERLGRARDDVLPGDPAEVAVRAKASERRVAHGGEGGRRRGEAPGLGRAPG